MLVKINSVAFKGLEASPIEVEVDVASQGFPGVNIVGLAGKAVEEARERIKTAIHNSGFDFPAKKITINLAPADMPKDGAAYDLPMAVGILVASGQLEAGQGEGRLNSRSWFYGALSLDGTLASTRGVMLAAMFARDQKDAELYVPVLGVNEAAAVGGVTTFPVRNLKELGDHLAGVKDLIAIGDIPASLEAVAVDTDIGEIAGQEQAKRAMLIAAAGGHNLLLSGPPGAGKTMLARAMPGIMPALSRAEALEVTRIYSAAGLLPAGQALIRKRPFRSPHHGISGAAMIGGGSIPIPGEVSLAHLGVLFLDEMAEFPRGVLESLRQPLEDGVVHISRAQARVSYPASFSLVAAINPCPCGFLGHEKKSCICGERQIEKYKQRISGPILDRIDLVVRVAGVEAEKLQQVPEKISDLWREKVAEAREKQRIRFRDKSLPIYTNSQMNNRIINQTVTCHPEATKLLNLAANKFDLSARGYFKTIKVAQTIADLAGEETINTGHMAEALQYRTKT